MFRIEEAPFHHHHIPDLLVGTTTSGSALLQVEVVDRDNGSRTRVRRKRKQPSKDDPLLDLFAVLEGSALVCFLDSKPTVF